MTRKLYDKGAIVSQIERALQEMEELGLDKWDSDGLPGPGLAIEILQSDRTLTACDYILHIFLYTDEDDITGTHIFDVSVSAKYDYKYWRDDLDLAFEQYSRVVCKQGE